MDQVQYSRFGPASVVFELPDTDDLPIEANRHGEIRALQYQLASLLEATDPSPEAATEIQRLKTNLRNQRSQIRLEQVRRTETILQQLASAPASAEFQAQGKQALAEMQAVYTGEWVSDLAQDVALLIDALVRKAGPLVKGGQVPGVDTSALIRAVKPPPAGMLASEAGTVLKLERLLSRLAQAKESTSAQEDRPTEAAAPRNPLVSSHVLHQRKPESKERSASAQAIARAEAARPKPSPRSRQAERTAESLDLVAIEFAEQIQQARSVFAQVGKQARLVSLRLFLRLLDPLLEKVKNLVPAPPAMPVPVSAPVERTPLQSGFQAIAELNIRFLDNRDRPLYVVNRVQPLGRAEENLILLNAISSIQECAPFTEGHPGPAKGYYQGTPMSKIMREVKDVDVRQFLAFIKAKPKKYVGNSYKISEAFASWVVQDSPMEYDK